MPTEDEFLKIKNRIEEHEKRIMKLEKSFQPEMENHRKKMSIGEFLLSKNPKTEVEKTLTIGFYLEKYEGHSSFNKKDLEKGFRDAKEPVPDNINHRVILNIRNGHMMEAKEKKENKKAWLLTNSGEEHVRKDFKEQE
jgi:hypothetical protein